MAPTVFIDGEAGTTGLQIRTRLADRQDIEVLSLPDEHRKDPKRRATLLNTADLAILCLPDEAAREAVALIGSANTRVIDTSTAHRVAPDWVFGFPEIEPGQTERIADARLVSNPGCFSTGVIALLRPLVGEGLIPPGYPLQINAVSGYTGGGRGLIARFEDPNAPDAIESQHFIYGLSLSHKHVPEMQQRVGLSRRPIFLPSVGRFRQGMIVQFGVYLDDLPDRPSADRLRQVLADWYAGQRYVEVIARDQSASLEHVYPDELNGTNKMRLRVFGADDAGHALLVATLDNLGKGASGAAVQNLNLMLGLASDAGLDGKRLAAE